MDNKQLHKTLAQLHTELEQTQAVDDNSRELLQHLMKDIQGVLNTSGKVPAHRYQSLGERLRQAVDHFETTHPQLTLTIGEVLDNLAAVGL